MINPENHWFNQMSLDCLGQTYLVPIVRLARRLQKKMLRRRRVSHSPLEIFLSRLFLSVGCSLFYITGFESYQWLIFCLFAGDAERIPGISGNEDVSTGVDTDRQLIGRHVLVTRSLVPLAVGPT